MNRRATTRPAFSLIELIVAAIITALLAGGVAGSMSRLVDIRARIQRRAEALSRADAAADRIALDALAVVRDHDLTFCRVAVTDHQVNGRDRDELLMLVRSLRRIRPLADGPEAADHEVQYRVVSDVDSPALWRRADHAFDRAQDAGGIAEPIVDAVVSLSVQAFDGESWYDVWDSDYDGLPHALRVTVVAQSDPDGDRAPAAATARRIIAIDRTPLLVEAANEDDLEAPGDESADAPASNDNGSQSGQGTQDGQDTGGAPGGNTGGQGPPDGGNGGAR